MSTSTWWLLQFVVAGCTGLLMWSLIRIAGNVWERFASRKRARTDRTMSVRVERRDTR